MKTSLIMAILLCLCFTFAGASALAADKEIKGKKGNEEITVTVDDEDNYKLKKVIVKKDGETAGEDMTERSIERHGDDVTQLQIKRENGPADVIRSVPNDTVIISGDGTCAWYFYGGGWHQYCW